MSSHVSQAIIPAQERRPPSAEGNPITLQLHRGVKHTPGWRCSSDEAPELVITRDLLLYSLAVPARGPHKIPHGPTWARRNGVVGSTWTWYTLLPPSTHLCDKSCGHLKLTLDVVTCGRCNGCSTVGHHSCVNVGQISPPAIHLSRSQTDSYGDVARCCV